MEALEEEYQEYLWDLIYSYAEKHDLNIIAIVGTFQDQPFRQDIHYTFTIDFLNHLDLDGLIIIGNSLTQYIAEKELYDILSKIIDIPKVSLGHMFNDISYVNINNKIGIEKALSHFINVHKCSKPAFFCGPVDNVDAQERLTGFKDSLRKFNLPVREDFIIPGSFSIKAGRESVQMIIDHLDQIDCVIAADDHIAMGAIMEFRKLGINVPDDIYIIGFDNSYNAEYFYPPISSVKPKLELLGAQTFSALERIINNPEIIIKELIEPDLIIRNSCGCGQKRSDDLLLNFDYSKTGADFRQRLKEAIKKEDDTMFFEWFIRRIKILSYSPEAVLWFHSMICHECREINNQLANDELSHSISFFNKIQVKISKLILKHHDILLSINIEKEREYNELKRQLLNVYTKDRLRTILESEIPTLLNSFFLVLYDNKAVKQSDNSYKSPQYSHLFFAYIEDEKSLDKELRFETNEFLPAEYHKLLYRDHYIFMNLSLCDEYFGYIFLKYNKNAPVALYENLRLYLSTAVKNIDLVSKLEKSITQKADFFVNIAHEIKTPLTLMDNYLEIYLNNPNDNQSLTILRENIKKMKRDMMHYLDSEKFAKNIPLYNHGQIINLAKYLTASLSLFNDYATCKNIRIQTEIEEDCFIKMDPMGLNRVLDNLLDNAVKYTPQNGLITCRIESDKEKISFTIKNTGLIIQTEFLSEIFNPYFQMSREKRSNEGVGMGLFMVKNIIEEAGGIITPAIEDEFISFKIIFSKYHEISNEKVLKPDRPIIPSITKLPVTENQDKMKDTILIAEDNVQMAAFMLRALGKEFNVFYAENGKECMEQLNNGPCPDLIISDVMMDEMNGFELCKKISDDENFRVIPFLFVTAKTGIREKITGLTLGAVDYITKPFILPELQSKVRSIIKNGKDQKVKYFQEIGIQVKELFENSNHYKKPVLSNNSNSIKYNITKKESMVIEGLSNGLSYEQIALDLDVSINTIRSHIRRIYKKCSINNKMELICLFAS